MWNYRVFQVDSYTQEEDGHEEIREVYYRDDGVIAFIGAQASSVHWFPEFGEDFNTTIELMRRALHEKTLNLDEVEREIDERGTQELD